MKEIFTWKYRFFREEKQQKSFFPPKYRGKVLLGDVAEVAEEIISENCKELDIGIIEMAMNVDPIHLFIRNPFRKSLIKNASLLRNPWGMAGKWWRSIYRDINVTRR